MNSLLMFVGALVVIVGAGGSYSVGDTRAVALVMLIGSIMFVVGVML